MRVTICIATFQRPKLLRALLTGLSALTFQKVQPPEVSLIVADNDCAGSAREVCESTPLPWPLRYVIEPERGLAQVRNRYLKEAGDAEYIALIDDDEVPEPDWLDCLLDTQEKFQSDVVAGPVIPIFTDDVPGWIKAGGFFDRPTYTTGQVIDFCLTGNALVLKSVFGRVGTFDNQFKLCGGEDVQFFMRVKQAGLVIAWCDEAIVRERIAKDRANLSCLLRRSYRGGNSYALIEASFNKRFSVRSIRFAKGCAKLMLGIVQLVPAAFFGRASVTKALRVVWLGAGMLTGVCDIRYQAYRTVSGDPL